MEGCALTLASKLDFLEERLRELVASPAWAGQIGFQIQPDRTGVSLSVRNRFVRDWIRENYIPQVQKRMEPHPGESPSIHIIVQEAPLGAAATGATATTTPQRPRESQPQIPEPSEAEGPFHETLKQKYSFQNFVVGSSNQFAHAAARAVSKMPGKNYNPLFVYGGVGLGKTHLLNAIGLDILQMNPRSRIICLSSEKFMNEMIHCMRFDKMVDFRKKYREGCDVLLLDDIQFIAGKERTQEEFFHTFNHLYDSQRQIVLTSDKPPRDIPDLEERLRSRFEWGLLADITIPDLETRMAILKRKADYDGIPIDDEVALFLASHIKSNVRELEGSLIRLNAFASLAGAPISIALAKDVMKNVFAPVDRVLTVEQVQKTVADFFRIKLADLTGKRRVKSLALPRQIAMYLSRKHIHSSFPEIGHKFGGKDHSTVIHACHKIEKAVKSDPSLKEQVDHLEQNITR